jgi:hypothetical protein
MTKMVLPAVRLSLEKKNISKPSKMPVVILNQLLLSLNPQDWVTQSKARGRVRRKQVIN